MKIPEKCCRKCGNVTFYSGKNYYECMKKRVSAYGICDRFQKKCTSEELMRKIDLAISRMENYEDGEYIIKPLPDYGQNYREQEITK